MTLIISVLSSLSTIKILIGRLKNYHITRTVPLPAATVVYCKTNALPAGNRPEITVVILTTLETPKNLFCFNNNIMSDNSKQDHPAELCGQARRALPGIFRLSTQKNTCQIFFSLFMGLGCIKLKVACCVTDREQYM